MGISLNVATLMEYFYVSGESRNLSEKTQEFYRKKLCFFVSAYGDCPADSLTVHQLRGLVATLQRERKWAVGQVNHFITAVKVFFNYLIDEELIEHNPATRLAKLKVERHLLEVLTREDVQAVLNVIPNNSFVGTRDRTMILLLLDTGIRCAELMSLTVDSVHLGSLTIEVFGKGRKGRCVPISPVLARVLIKYLAARAKVVDDSQQSALWISQRGAALSYYYLPHTFPQYEKAARLTKHLHPHAFRHLFATEFLRNGGHPGQLQVILGHTSPTMTARYTHLTDTDAARDHRTASPLSHWRNLAR